MSRDEEYKLYGFFSGLAVTIQSAYLWKVMAIKEDKNMTMHKVRQKECDKHQAVLRRLSFGHTVRISKAITALWTLRTGRPKSTPEENEIIPLMLLLKR